MRITQATVLPRNRAGHCARGFRVAF
jgi:hypothetical protein